MKANRMKSICDTILFQEFEKAMAEGNLIKALEYGKRMATEYSSYPLAHYSLATAYEERQEWADAVLAYHKSLEADKQAWSTPANSNAPLSAAFAVECAGVLHYAQLGLGRCYEMMGMQEQAIKAYEAFLVECPEHEGAQEAIKRLQ